MKIRHYRVMKNNKFISVELFNACFFKIIQNVMFKIRYSHQYLFFFYEEEWEIFCRPVYGYLKLTVASVIIITPFFALHGRRAMLHSCPDIEQINFLFIIMNFLFIIINFNFENSGLILAPYPSSFYHLFNMSLQEHCSLNSLLLNKYLINNSRRKRFMKKFNFLLIEILSETN